ncbi:Major facilitator superfamily domain general substrate transporter [Penicillium sp. DV-2018c]|nr:Major facilitator superfamily domain general substrate transporter [Penicillium sp. DV-2018c]
MAELPSWHEEVTFVLMESDKGFTAFYHGKCFVVRWGLSHPRHDCRPVGTRFPAIQHSDGITPLNWTKPALGLRHIRPLVDHHNVEITKVIASGTTRVVTVPSVHAAIGAAAAAQPEMAMPARNMGQTVGPRHLPKLRRRATWQAESAGTGQQTEPADAKMANHETMTVKADAGIVSVIGPCLLGLKPGVDLTLRMELPGQLTLDRRSSPSALSGGSEGPHICEATSKTRTSRPQTWHIVTSRDHELGLEIDKDLRRFITQSVLSSAGGSVTVGMIADLWEPDSQQYAREYGRLHRCFNRMKWTTLKSLRIIRRK